MSEALAKSLIEELRGIVRLDSGAMISMEGTFLIIGEAEEECDLIDSLNLYTRGKKYLQCYPNDLGQPAILRARPA